MALNPFEGTLGYFRVFRRHLGRRLYIIFGLALLAALTEGVGITLLLPLIAALDVGIGASEGTPKFVKDVILALGLEGSTTGLLALVWSAFLLKGVITFAYQGYAGSLQARLQQQLSRNLYDGIRQADYAYYSRHNTGHFVNLINSQVYAFYQSFTTFLQFMVNCIKGIAYFAVAMLLAWRFGVMALVAGMVVLIVLRSLSGLIKRLSQLTVAEMSTLNKLLVQAVQAFKYLVSTDTMKGMAKPIEASLRKVRHYRSRQLVWHAFTASLSEPLSITLILTIILVQVAYLDQPLAPILVSILLFHRGMSTLMTLLAQWQQSMATIGAVEVLEREFELLDRAQAPVGSIRAPTLDRGIELVSISYRYAEDSEPVLKSLSLSIPARKTTALIGRSGAGKSTLVDILTLLLRPQSGQVLVDGQTAADFQPASWRQQIGYVSQETVVFDDSIAANIALTPIGPDGDPEHIQRIRQAASDAHLDDVLGALPNGLWTEVGDRGIRLSGGQRQRLFIARELFRRPRLLILDEATSALDSESEAAVQESIDALRGQITIVVIAHRLATVRNADWIYVLSDGRVVEEGSYAELRGRDNSRLAAMIEMQTL